MYHLEEILKLKADFPLMATQKRGLTVSLVGILLAVVVLHFGTMPDAPPVDPEQFGTIQAAVPYAPTPIEINVADSSEWKKLRGIGPVLSVRIPKYRERKGGFHEVTELQEVYGLSPETYQAILPYLYVDTTSAAFMALQAAKPDYKRTKHSWKKTPKVHIELNSADSAELRQVKGIGAVLSARILKYRAKRGGFDKAEDLLEVYGVQEGENYEGIAAQLYVDPSLKPAPEPKKEYKPDTTYVYSPTKYDAAPVDLNLADTTALLGLPGIGSKTANRIVKFRNGLGFFHSVDQLHEVWGLSETNYLRMAPYLFVSTSLEGLPHVLINTATVDQLRKHPYIDYKLAKQIVAYREAHGAFKQLGDLDQLYGVKEGIWEKLTPYLVF